MTDAELVARARAGDPEAFGTLARRHHPACLRFARHLLGDPEDAMDVVQDSFVRAYRGLDRYRERESFRAWLFQILVNRCRSEGRRRARRREQLRRLEPPAPVPGVAVRVDAALRLERALVGLDAEHREAFLLKVGEEMAYDEIAQVTGATVAALRMRVLRAREHVRARWEANGDA